MLASVTEPLDRADINALIEDASEQLGVVRELYHKTLQEKEASQRLKTRIKNVLENQRSALEYTAHAIVQRHGDPKCHSYYPVARSPSEFRRAFKRTLPGIKSNAVREAIEARQPYQRGYEWLGHLVTLTNENKHRRLTPQQRKETKMIETKGPGGGQIGYTEGVTFLPGDQGISVSPGGSISFGPGGSIGFGPEGTLVSGVPMDPRTQRPVATPGATVEEIVYVDWLFEDPQLSALGTLGRIQDSLPALIAEVLAVSGL